MEKFVLSQSVEPKAETKMWEFYEELKEIVYVSDVDSHELVYMNRWARELYGISSMDEIKGKKCYEVLSGSGVPCATCNCDKLQEGIWTEKVKYYPVLKKKLSSKDTLVKYEGRRCRFDLSVEVSDREQSDTAYEANEVMVNEGLRISLAAHTPEKSIAALLEYLGQSLDSERVYIFEEADGKTFDNTYEWCAKGVVPQKDNLQNVPYKVVSLWYQKFNKGENIIIKNLESVRESDREAYECLMPQNVQSLVVSPLVSEGRIVGFYGVDNPPEKSMEHIKTLLQILGHFIVALLHRKSHVRRLEELCFHDQLTGLENRHAAHDYIASVKEEESIGIVYCDVMGLKRANDTEGHQAGDKLLIRASECLKKIFGEYRLFRVGGDEFIALCTGIEEEELSKRVERLKVDMCKKYAPMSIGCVWSADSRESIDKMLTVADNRMYENKRMLYATEYKDLAR